MAIESMTGFARSEVAGPDGAKIICEIRSVNGKSLDMRLKLPSGFDRLEPQARQIIQSCFTRGNLQVNIAFEQDSAVAALQINDALLEQIVNLATRLRDKHGLEMPGIGELLAVRGVLDNGAAAPATQFDAPILEALTIACAELKRFRAGEGAALVQILLDQVARIEQLATAAAADPSRTPQAIRDRLAAQIRLITDSVQGFDEQRLAAEAAFLATKADIREELDRLSAHIQSTRALLSAQGPVGRKLDFIAQEFNREANTLCSKSNAASVTNIGLELKAVVDQFREQVQNLE